MLLFNDYKTSSIYYLAEVYDSYRRVALCGLYVVGNEDPVVSQGWGLRSHTIKILLILNLHKILVFIIIIALVILPSSFALSCS